jgi:phosphatidylinositol alpha-mannosyltransferase
VQFHVRDLSEVLQERGHEVSVLAPADDDTPLPPYVVPAGRAVPVPYNGSVARVNIGPISAARVRRWVRDGRFDLLHIHEPATPSLSLLACWAATGPIVATFHTSNLRSRAMQAAYPLLRPSLEKILARIAVSEDARRTVTTHIGGDAVVIPNGVNVSSFAGASTRPEWTGTPERPTMAFLGRIDEPRKGLPVIAAAMPSILEEYPGARLLVAGPGDAAAARAQMTPATARAAEFLGGISDADKAALLASTDMYVAPHTGGESFGIVLVEAMAAGAPVVASDLPAFVRVLDGGRAGATFPNEDSGALAKTVQTLLGDRDRRAELSAIGRKRAEVFDWSVVAEDVMAVYETVMHPLAHIRGAADSATLWTRLRRGRGADRS